MTDNELLELAAKAACIQIDRWHGDGGDYWTGRDADDKDRNPGLWIRWNPLRDDGDALRLAVKLEITIYTPQTKTMQSDIVCAQNFDGAIDCCEKSESDPYSATRRAIVRAAAAIGEQMK